MIHTLRGLLILLATVTLLSLLALGGMAIQASRSGAALLSEVNDQAVVPLTVLQFFRRGTRATASPACSTDLPPLRTGAA